MEITIDYLAIVSAAAAAMALGALWYGPLFGKEWRRLMGMSMDDVKSMPLSVTQAMGLGFVVALIMAYVLNHILVFSTTFYGNELNYTAGLMSAFWIWLGFVTTTQIGVVLWEGKPWKLFFLNTAYSLVLLAAMGIIISSWPA